MVLWRVLLGLRFVIGNSNEPNAQTFYAKFVFAVNKNSYEYRKSLWGFVFLITFGRRWKQRKKKTSATTEDSTGLRYRPVNSALWFFGSFASPKECVSDRRLLCGYKVLCLIWIKCLLCLRVWTKKVFGAVGTTELKEKIEKYQSLNLSPFFPSVRK